MAETRRLGEELRPERRLAASIMLGAVLFAYIGGVLVVTVVEATQGPWWPAALASVGMIVLVMAVFWTWLDERLAVAGQSAAIAALMMVSAAAFAIEFDRARAFGVMSLVALVVAAASASAFLASSRAPGVGDVPTRVAVGAACLLLAQHLAVLPPLDWFLPVGTWGLAGAVFVVRTLVTHDPERFPDPGEQDQEADPSASNL